MSCVGQVLQKVSGLPFGVQNGPSHADCHIGINGAPSRCPMRGCPARLGLALKESAGFAHILHRFAFFGEGQGFEIAQLKSFASFPVAFPVLLGFPDLPVNFHHSKSSNGGCRLDPFLSRLAVSWQSA